VTELSNTYFPIITDEETNLPFYLKGIGIQENQERIVRPNGHPDFHWIHTTKGKGCLLINHKQYIISENMGFFILPGVSHEYYRLDEIWETHWITFDGFAVQELLKNTLLSENSVFYLQDYHLIEENFEKILRLAKITSSFNRFQTSVYLYQFLIMCRNCISSTNRSKFTKQKQLAPVIAFLEKNFDTNPSLEEMAKLIDVTPHHLCRLFKEEFKIRPFVYLTKIRLQRAKELMMQTDNFTVKYVAQKIGYNDISYFCSIFKKYEGITPTEFRNMHMKY
jgi:AraC family transcriptional regulator of arabinose operon